MTLSQGSLFALIGLLFVFLIWGRFRYDLVAFAALVLAALLGLVPSDEVFSGFSHPAVIVVALVLVISKGLARSGALEIIARLVIDAGRSLGSHVAIMGTLSAALSTLMNNVAALALLMPMDVQAAQKAKRSPALTLMPLSFASILGGMVTLIGTPPNIVIATFREDALGEPYSMFDFAPVGMAVAVVGVLFVALVGWRLIPNARTKADSVRELMELSGYISEVALPADSEYLGKQLGELDEPAEKNEVTVLGVVRRGQQQREKARSAELRKSDIVIVEGSPQAIDQFVGATGLSYVGVDRHFANNDSAIGLIEAVVPSGARIVERSARQSRLLYRQGVTLLGISRKGKRIRGRVRRTIIRPGDILLLLGPEERLSDAVEWLGCLPLAERGLGLVERHKALLAVGVFGAAIAAASFGLVSLPLALAAVTVIYMATRVVPLSQVYEAIEWPVIVLLGSLIPIGHALETSGGADLIAQSFVGLTAQLPAIAILGLLMVITMTLSDVLNNVATALIAAPIAIDIAARLDANPDAFLMGVAVAASCAFLTPIGHKNNTIIMGPGGYKFGDYWRMGLPLELLVLAVGIPMIAIVWPL